MVNVFNVYWCDSLLVSTALNNNIVPSLVCSWLNCVNLFALVHHHTPSFCLTGLEQAFSSP